MPSMVALRQWISDVRDEDEATGVCSALQDAQWHGGIANVGGGEPGGTSGCLYRFRCPVHTSLPFVATANLKVGL